jgi:7-cyano-7-deazaguanine synthase
MRKQLLMFSGGPDSTAAAYLLSATRSLSLLTLFDETGAKNTGETRAAKLIAQQLQLPHKVVEIAALNSLLDGIPNTLIGLGGANPLNKPAILLDSKATCVGPGASEAPLGMQLLHLCAAIYGISHGFESMAWAVHKNDDICNEGWIAEYISRFNQLMNLTGHNFEIEAPFLSLTKADLVRSAYEKGAPLGLSFSCLVSGAEVHCGKCQGCVERKRAFIAAGIPSSCSTPQSGRQVA